MTQSYSGASCPVRKRQKLPATGRISFLIAIAGLSTLPLWRLRQLAAFISTPALKLAKAHCFHRRLWVSGLSAGQSSDPKRLQCHLQIAMEPCNSTKLLQLQHWQFGINRSE
ncbi:hypothetical protein FIM25_01400 [Desulfobotulus mexicanus]|uniref:Uncharacterized protein n=1 Tax=Desulfobotulus mexicanus TaxID=2586642 RepID=A0A5Q4VF03_9BACT|nr:hypothetical protein FIM25_01400 [Desulfobotulus mexicanus]